MGSKPGRRGKHLLFYAASFLILGLGGQGCVLLPERWEGDLVLSRAKTSMAEGNYDASFDENSEVLTRFSVTHGDLALHQMGILFAHPENPDRDPEKALHFFHRLLREFPQSKVRQETQMWITLIQRMAFQEKEIEKLRRGIELQKAAARAEREKADLLKGASEERKEKTISLTRRLSELQGQVEQLERQIRELKRVDLGTEEKKRNSIP